MLYILLGVIVLCCIVRGRKKKQQNKKKGGFFKRLIRAIMIGAVSCFVMMLLIGSGADDSSQPDNVKTTTEPRLTVTATQSPTAAPSSAPIPTATIFEKPGIAGSNAYDLTIGAEENGLTVGKRQQTTDGYSWLISGTTYYGSYTISIETNKQYEIHRATFAHAGKDATFFPWAVTLPFDAADIEGATAWVKACQKADQEATFVAGDAVWTYIPHENGQHGGVLTLTVDMFEEYSRYLLDQL